MGSAPTKKHVVYFKHPLLGDVTPKERYGTRQMIYRHAVSPSTDLAAWQESFHGLELDNRDFLFLPFDFRVNTKQGVCCGQSAQVDLTFELYQHILDSEIANRRHSSKHFTEEELWYLLYNVLESCKDFEYAEDQKIGDIRPKNILLNDTGKIKLINRWSWPGEVSGLEKVLNATGDKCYLAPEELAAMRVKGAIAGLDQHKTDVFSIGVTFLQLATLKSSEDLYNYQNGTFDEQLLQGRKKQMLRHYSQYFCKVVDSLADVNIERRGTCGETWAVLNPNAEDINQLRKFVPIKAACEESLKKYKRKTGRRLQK